MTGEWSFFNDRGKLESKGAYQEGLQDGNFEFFFSDGTVEGRGAFKRGLREGPWQQFDLNGDTTIKTKYKIKYRSEQTH